MVFFYFSELNIVSNLSDMAKPRQKSLTQSSTRQLYCSSTQQWLQAFQKTKKSKIWYILCNVKHFYSWDDDIHCPQAGSKSTFSRKNQYFLCQLSVFPISIV